MQPASPFDIDCGPKLHSLRLICSKGHDTTVCVQVNAAAKSVHAPVMDPEGKLLDPEGDSQLRGSYTRNMLKLMERAGATRPVRDAVDLGCATGAGSCPLRVSSIFNIFSQPPISPIDLLRRRRGHQHC
jgi:hypothetical protein